MVQTGSVEERVCIDMLARYLIHTIIELLDCNTSGRVKALFLLVRAYVAFLKFKDDNSTPNTMLINSILTKTVRHCYAALQEASLSSRVISIPWTFDLLFACFEKVLK